MNEKDRDCMDEGLMRDAGRVWDAKGDDRTGGWKRSKPPSPDGERRENEDGGLRSMTPITLSSSAMLVGARHRNPNTSNAAYCDDDHKNGRSRTFVEERTPLTLSLPPSRESRCHGARDKDAGGATSARRKNPPCKSLPAGMRMIEKRERESG